MVLQFSDKTHWTWMGDGIPRPTLSLGVLVMGGCWGRESFLQEWGPCEVTVAIHTPI